MYIFFHLQPLSLFFFYYMFLLHVFFSSIAVVLQSFPNWFLPWSGFFSSTLHTFVFFIIYIFFLTLPFLRITFVFFFFLSNCLVFFDFFSSFAVALHSYFSHFGFSLIFLLFFVFYYYFFFFCFYFLAVFSLVSRRWKICRVAFIGTNKEPTFCSLALILFPLFLLIVRINNGTWEERMQFNGELNDRFSIL